MKIERIEAPKIDRVWRGRSRSAKWKRLNPQPQWIRDLQIGDVLQTRGGRAHRIVRAISRMGDGEVYCVEFVKRARSRYPSPTTILYWYELLQRGMSKVDGIRIKLDREIDHRIACSIEKHLDCPIFIDQKDAIGIP